MLKRQQTSNEELIARIQAGENVQENMLWLWQQNRGLIYTIAKRYIGYSEIDDLMQEGYIGLHEAVKRYDPDSENKFSTYLKLWIRQAIGRYIDNCTGAARIPVYTKERYLQYKRLKEKYEKEYGRPISGKEAQIVLGVSDELMECFQKIELLEDCKSLEAPIAEDLTLADTVRNDGEELERKVDHEAMSKELWGMVASLGEKQQSIVRDVYGNNCMVADAGERCGVSKQRASQIKQEALRKLKRGKGASILKGYYDEYMNTYVIHHVGVEGFQRTWTSEVEQAVMDREKVFGR